MGTAVRQTEDGGYVITGASSYVYYDEEQDRNEPRYDLLLIRTNERGDFPIKPTHHRERPKIFIKRDHRMRDRDNSRFYFGLFPSVLNLLRKKEGPNHHEGIDIVTNGSNTRR